jgi:ABC-type lipoprotein release transport system permease subunit
MFLEARLAWRNVWRNPRRTALTVAATVFAVVLVVIFVAMAAGVHGKMIDDSVRVHSGHVSVVGRGYLEERTLERFVRFDAALATLLERTPGIKGWAPRVLGFGLLAKGSATRGVAVLGVDPEREPTVTTLPARLRQGVFVSAAQRRGIVLGERLAKSLSATVGDDLLLYSIAYSLEAAYDLFRVVGVMKLPEPGLDRTLAVISLDDAQEFYVYDDRVTEVAVLADTEAQTEAITMRLGDTLPGLVADAGPPAEAHAWDELMPELRQLIFLDDAGMYIMLAILVIVVGFGILNTMLMSVLERRREFGVVLALGLRPVALLRMVYIESVLLAVLGVVVGLAIAIPLTVYLAAHPIPLSGAAVGAMELWGVEPVITFKLKPLNPIGTVITICAIAIVAALYPAVKASRNRPVDALRSI